MTMHKRTMLAAGMAIALTGGSVLISHSTSFGEGKSGEALFKQHCAVCHPDGSNIMNPKKTLHKKDRDANNVRTESDIVKIMRNPGPGMTKFDGKMISDAEAKEIASYVMKVFK